MMVFHEEEDCQDFLSLLHIPSKPPGDYFTIADVFRNGNNLRGEHVNLLVAVQDVSTEWYNCEVILNFGHCEIVPLNVIYKSIPVVHGAMGCGQKSFKLV